MKKIYASYFYNKCGVTGYGNCFVDVREYPLTQKDIYELQEKLEAKHDITDVMLISFQEIRKEKELC